MSLTFVDTHNIVAYLSKSDTSEGFNQIIDFLNGSSLKYALTVNPNIYVSCIKQFWATVAVKQVNDVTRLQALVDRKKVVVTDAIIREALRLDDAEGVDCLPNEEIFTELARMGYEEPSTKLTFYKAFFSSQWKFLIHTQCMSAKRTYWNEFSSSMASAVICLSSGRKFNFSKYIFDSLARKVYSTTKFYMYPCFLQLIIRKQVGDLLTHTTKYASPALTQKVFTNMKRVRKGFSGVETFLFEGMLVEQEIDEEGDVAEHVKEVNTGDAAEGDDSATHGEFLAVQPTSPQSQPPQAADFPMSLLQEAIDACAAPTRRVEHLEYDKVAQALKITKLKIRVKKLEKRNKGRMIAEMDQDDAVVLKDDKDVVDTVKDVEEAKVDESAQNQGRQAESQAEIYKIDMDHANKVLSMQEDETEPAEVQEVVDDPKEESTTSTIIPVETKSKDKSKGILVEEPKPLKKKQQIAMDEQYARELHVELNKDIDWDEAIDHVKRKAKEDLAVKRYQAMKRKPQTEAQARKNIMMYLKNVVGFKMDYFKGMSYDDIHPIFETKFNSNLAFLLKTKEQIEEDENKALKTINKTPAERAAKRIKLDEEVEDLKRHLQIMPDKEDDVYTEATPLARKVLVVDYEIIDINNKPYYKIIRADGTHQLYINFLTLLRNFDREDLEALWSLVKERFSTTKPKNFSDNFLLTTLGAMFEKPDAHAQIWKNQRSVHGQAKIKSWKLLESCGVRIITFTTTQLILLVEKSFGVDAAMDKKHAKCLMLVVKNLVLPSKVDAAVDKVKTANVKCCCWNTNEEITKGVRLPHVVWLFRSEGYAYPMLYGDLDRRGTPTPCCVVIWIGGVGLPHIVWYILEEKLIEEEPLEEPKEEGYLEESEKGYPIGCS
nr:hypothetical protein [Tanacetum cinerariifolium]